VNVLARLRAHLPGRRPRYVSRWDHYVDPYLTTARWWATGRYLCCGRKRRDGHKFGCSVGGSQRTVLPMRLVEREGDDNR